MDLKKHTCLYKVSVTSVSKHENGRLLAHLSNGTSVECDKVIIATGRVPNIAKLKLENTDIVLNKDKTIKVDEFQESSVKGIFSIGDVALSKL